MLSKFFSFLAEIPEVREARNCLNVSVNRFIFTPQPAAYDFFSFFQKESSSSNFVCELIFVPVVVEGCFRYDIPCIWIHKKRSNEARDPTAASPTKNPIILYFHGTSSNIGNHAEEMKSIAEKISSCDADANVDVVLAEYPSYGIASSFLPGVNPTAANKKATGFSSSSSSFNIVPTEFLLSDKGALFHPNTEKLRLVGQKVLEFVIDRKNKLNNGTTTSKKDIILIGRSMGTGLVLELAAHETFSKHIASVVLLAPYTSIPRVVKEYLCRNVPSYVGGRWTAEKVLFPFINLMFRLSDSAFFASAENVRRIAENKIPIAAFHGLKDTLINKQHTDDLKKHFSLGLNDASSQQQTNSDDSFFTFWDPNGTHGEIDFHAQLIVFLSKLLLQEHAIDASHRISDLMPELVIPKSENELKARKIRFMAEMKEAEMLKKKAIMTLRFVVLTTIGLSVMLVLYFWYF